MDFTDVRTVEEFNQLALEIFRFQSVENPVYREYLSLLGVKPSSVFNPEKIPFLPIEFFKSHRICSGAGEPEIEFTSSGTSGLKPSHHFILKKAFYEKSLLDGFQLFFGDPKAWCLLALLPSYLERSGSSLVYMMNRLIELSGHPNGGFYLHNLNDLADKLKQQVQSGEPTLLIGVSYALLDLAEQYPMDLRPIRIMETGGMKGHRKEMIRPELHQQLKNAFHVDAIGSEYGMTELLSQAYSTGSGIFHTPPWMQIRIRDPYNPLQSIANGKTGGIDVIDLANRFSCSFIQTQDLGRMHDDGSFEVLGRLDHSDIRGCNLLIEN